jgi:hypothetical protein
MSSKTEFTFEIILLGATFEDGLYVKPTRVVVELAGHEVLGHGLAAGTVHFLYVNLK